MSWPRSKSEGRWLTELRELRVACHKPRTKKWVKRKLGKARRQSGKEAACPADSAASATREVALFGSAGEAALRSHCPAGAGAGAGASGSGGSESR